MHLCPGLNAVTNFADFTIFCFSFKLNKFCDFSLNSTRYTKIRCLDDFWVRCAKIYNFMLITSKYRLVDFTKFTIFRYFSISHCEICDFLHFFVMQISPTCAGLRILQNFVMQIPPACADLQILQNLRFFAVNIAQKDRQRRQACLCSLWNEKTG